MRALLALARGIDRVNAGIGAMVSWLTVAMVAIGALNALARYGGRWGGNTLASNTWIEAQWYLFSLVFLLGAGYTLHKDDHVRVDVLYGRLSRRGRAWIDLVGGLVFLLPFCAFGFLFSLPAVRNSWVVREGSPDPGGLPRWPLKAMILVAFALLALQGLAQLIHLVAKLRGAEPWDDEPAAPRPPPTAADGSPTS